MTKVRNRMWTYTILVVGGFLLFFLYRYIGSRVWGLTYPQNSFWYDTYDQFMDFFNVNYMAASFDPYYHGSSYPPLALMLAFFVSKLIPETTQMDAINVRDYILAGRIVFFSMYFISILVIVLTICSRLRLILKDEPLDTNDSKYAIIRFIRWLFSKDMLLVIAVTFSTVLAAPMIYGFDRGNYIIITVIFIVLFSLYYDRNPYLSAVFLAIAAALKVFPVVIFLVLILGKKWKPLFLGLFTGGFLTALCAYLFDGGMIYNLQRFFNATFLYTGGFDPNSLYYYRHAVGIRNLVGSFWLIISRSNVISLHIGPISTVVGILVFILVVVLCVFDKRKWRQILYLSIFMVLFPTPSFYYNIMYLLGPMVAFIFKKKWSRWDTIILISLAVLMIPKNYYYILGRFAEGKAWISINTFIDPFIMCSILGLAIVELWFYRKQNKSLSNSPNHEPII